MNVRKFFFASVAFSLIVSFTLTTCGSFSAQSNSSSSEGEAESIPYWTGDGAKNDSIAILPLTGQGLSNEEELIPVTVQGILVGDMSGFSAMRVVDRINLDNIIAEGESGYYADENNFAQLGQLANVRYIMNGSVQKTGTGFVLQLRVSEANGTSRAVYTGNCRLEELENQSAVKQASVYLLEQLGVKLTSAGQEALMAPVTEARRQADNALARGIIAQRQGTEVAALSYYFQAVAYDPSLLEAMNRSSILNANISSGNIGEDVRNDIAWRRNWVQRLTETEQSFAEFNRTESIPYTLFYAEDIQQGAVNYRDETVILSIETYLRPSHTWGRTVGIPMQQTLKAVYDGLQATKRAGDWGLQGWPQRGVTNLNSFARRSNSFTITAELLDDQNRVIGRQSFQSDGYWEFTYNGNAPTGILISDDVRRTVNFIVKADDITDRLTIRIASVNGVDAETAARNGVMQIRAMPKAEYDLNGRYNAVLNFALGEIRGLSNNVRQENQVKIFEYFPDPKLYIPDSSFARSGFDLYIPDSIWGDPVVSISRKAFSRFITYIYTRNNTMEQAPARSVYLPDSITYVGEEAFSIYNNNINFDPDTISIGANVTLANHAFDEDNSFASYYIKNNRRAGLYKGHRGPAILLFGLWSFTPR